MDADSLTILGRAIDAAREDPDRDREEIVASLAPELERVAGARGEVHLRKLAEEALGSAKRQADDLGEHPSVATLDAMIGIGYALLSMGQDAEVFFSMLAERS